MRAIAITKVTYFPFYGGSGGWGKDCRIHTVLIDGALPAQEKSWAALGLTQPIAYHARSIYARR